MNNTVIINNNLHSACFIKNGKFVKIYSSNCCSEYVLYNNIYNQLSKKYKSILLCDPNCIVELPFKDYITEVDNDEIMKIHLNKWIKQMIDFQIFQLSKENNSKVNELNLYRILFHSNSKYQISIRVLIMPYFKSLINMDDIRKNKKIMRLLYDTVHYDTLVAKCYDFFKQLKTIIYDYLLPEGIYIFDLRTGNICFDMETQRFVLIDFESAYSRKFHQLMMNTPITIRYTEIDTEMNTLDSFFPYVMDDLFEQYKYTFFNPIIQHTTFHMHHFEKLKQIYQQRLYINPEHIHIKREYDNDIFTCMYYAHNLVMTFVHMNSILFNHQLLETYGKYIRKDLSYIANTSEFIEREYLNIITKLVQMTQTEYDKTNKYKLIVELLDIIHS